MFSAKQPLHSCFVIIYLSYEEVGSTCNIKTKRTIPMEVLLLNLPAWKFSE